MAAKDKKKGGKQGIVSKIANVGLILLGMSRPLGLIFRHLGNLQAGIDIIVRESTFGLGAPGGKFDLASGLRFYTPAGAAVALGFLKSYLMKKFPVRR